MDALATGSATRETWTLNLVLACDWPGTAAAQNPWTPGGPVATLPFPTSPPNLSEPPPYSSLKNPVALPVEIVPDSPATPTMSEVEPARD